MLREILLQKTTQAQQKQEEECAEDFPALRNGIVQMLDAAAQDGKRSYTWFSYIKVASPMRRLIRQWAEDEGLLLFERVHCTEGTEFTFQW